MEDGSSLLLFQLRPCATVIRHVLLHGHARDGAADHVESQVLQLFEADATFTHVELLAQPAEARVSILLYDALDFSTDRDDGRGQTRESLSRVASASAAVAGLDPARDRNGLALCDYPLSGCVRPRQSRRLRARHTYKIRAYWISLSRPR